MIKFLLYSNLLIVLLLIYQFNTNKNNKSNNKYIDYKLPLLTDIDYNKINGITDILWINLDRSEDRKLKLLDILNKINISNTRIKAIDGKNDNILNYIEDNNKLIDYNIYKLSKGEIACCLSHIKAISYITNILNKDINDNNYILIIEDDIKIDYLSIFNKDIKQIIDECPYNFDILMLYSTTNINFKDEYTNIKNKLIGGACSYIIKKDRINKLLDLIYYDFNLDKFIIKQPIKLQHADYFIFSYFNTYVYKYNFFNTNVDDSTLHNKYLKDFKKSNMKKKEILIKDLIYHE